MANNIVLNMVLVCLNRIYKWKKFLIAAIFTSLALFMSLAIWNYAPANNSLFHYGGDSVTISYSGYLGSTSAAFLLYFFGGASFIILTLLLLFSYMIVRRRSSRCEWDRILTLIVMLFVISALLSGYSYDPFCAECPGGYCGVALWAAVTAFFDVTSATFVFVALLIMTIIVVSRFPFIQTYAYGMRISLFLYSKRYLVFPIVRFGKNVAWYMILPIVKMVRWAAGLFTGTSVLESHESITMFDHDRENIESVNNVLKDECWNAYRANVEGANKQPMEAAVYCNDSDESSISPRKKRTTSCSDKENECLELRYELPDPGIFVDEHDEQQDVLAKNELEARARILEEKLERFGISGKVVAIKRGPVVTLFEYQPQIDTKLSKIIALEDDLAMALQALSIRILAPIPGRAVVGFEVSNNVRQNVLLGSVVQSKKFQSYKNGLPLILGCDTVGNDVIIDLAKMPHLLIAGSTGSGKSVALNSMLVSMLCRCTPEELKLILIDPKRLEFASYEDIAHLLFPIVTDPKQAISALRWVVKEMEQRYETMKELGARNMLDYNAVAVRNGLDPLPFIAIVIDELSDLMITAGRDIEDLIIRITQMARAAGIHMLVATQRPSVDVITGVIKVNFPSRISFRVTSKVDSRTILDCSGAEKLLGRGDMLFLDAGSSRLHRVHGAYVSDVEIEQLVASIKMQREPHYFELAEESSGPVDLLSGDDQLYKDVVTFLDGVDEVSISLLQRRFRIGYNRSARIIETLESEGVIAPSDGGKMRKVIHG